MAETSIKNLRVYGLARDLENEVETLLPKLPAEDYYTVNNDLRRTSSGVAHHINEAHRRYSFAVKLDSFHAAIAEAEHMKNLLTNYEKAGHGKTATIQENYVAVIKQCWGLIKYLRGRQQEFQTKQSAKAKDELIQARA